jgi:Iap family predicted aminopeptidase
MTNIYTLYTNVTVAHLISAHVSSYFEMPRILRLILITTILFCQDSMAQEPDYLAAARQDVAVLTSEAFMGRAYAFGGHDKASSYIRDSFSGLGLQSLGEDYYQSFPLVVDVILDTPRMSTSGKSLELGRDFLPFPSSASGEGQQVRMVRVGHGLYIPGTSINAYAGLDVKNAVVVFDAEVPAEIRQDTTIQADYLTKEARIHLATLLQAKAVVILTEQLIFGISGYNASIPVFEILKTSLDPEIKTLSYAVNTLQDQPFQTRNVIASVQGTEYPDSLILISAHYDHQGAMGPEVYFPGANDNASGTAMLLSLARHFAEHPGPYTMVFLAFSGEEKGLLGSRYFSEHPLIDLSKVRFMLNFDMVASAEDGVTAVGGVDHPTEFELLSQVNAEIGSDPLRKRKNAPNSDHYYLTTKGVKAFYLYTNKGKQPYHHIDDRPETLEWDDFAHVYELAVRFLRRL